MNRSPLYHHQRAVLPIGKLTLTQFLAALFILSSSFSSAQTGLPEWNKRDAERFEEPGSVLLGDGLWPINADGSSTQPVLDPELEALKEKLRGGSRILASDHIRPKFPLSIIEPNTTGRSLRPPPLNVHPTPLYLSATEVLPNELMPEYFGDDRPQQHLIDPQSFLTIQDAADINQLLRAHQQESPLEIYLMIFGSAQSIPDSISLSNLHHRWFGEKPAAIVIYHMQAPEKTRFEFGDKIHASLPSSSIDRVTYSCIREAQTTSNPVDQIKRLASEMSIRLFWMTSVIDGKHPVGNPLHGEKNESTQTASIIERIKTFFAAIWPAVKKNLLSIALLALASLAAYAIWIWRRDSISGRPIRFPERDLPMRLGGSHAGGAYIGMTFTPPAPRSTSADK